jgi:hypothetical protein
MAKLNLLVVAVLASLPLMAQTDTTPPQGTERNEPAPAVSGPILGSSTEPEAEEVPIEEHVVPVPSIVGGFTPTLSFSNRSERSNFFRAGITVGTNYDDNALITAGDAAGNWSYSIFPTLDIQKRTTRTLLDFGYAAGLTINQELTSQNQGSHDLNLNLLYRVSPHVNFVVEDHFSKTSGVFSQYDSASSPQNSPSGAINNLVLPVSNQLGNSVNAQLGYQFSADDAVGVSGGFHFQNFSDAPPGTLLLDNQSTQASGFYTHRLTPRNWLGASYGFRRLTLTSGAGEARAHSIVLFHTFTLPSKLVLSLFGGPEYTDDKVEPLSGTPVTNSGSRWAAAGGASLSVTGQKTAFLISFERHTTDGGGYQGPVQSIAFTSGLTRRLGKRWSIAAGGGYTKNDSLTEIAGLPSSLTSGFVNCGLERKFGENLSTHVGYSHEFIKGQDIAAPDKFQQRNRITISLSYGFVRPIGR